MQTTPQLLALYDAMEKSAGLGSVAARGGKALWSLLGKGVSKGYDAIKDVGHHIKTNTWDWKPNRWDAEYMLAPRAMQQVAKYIPKTVKQQLYLNRISNGIKQINVPSSQKVDVLPNYLFHAIKRSKEIPVSWNRSTFKKFDLPTYNRVVTSIIDANKYSAKLASALYQKALQMGANEKTLSSLLQQTGGLDAAQLVTALPKRTIGDVFRQLGDDIRLLPGRATNLYRTGENRLSSWTDTMSRKLSNWSKYSSRYYNDPNMVQRVRNAIVKDPRSSVTQFVVDKTLDPHNAYVKPRIIPEKMFLGKFTQFSPAVHAHEFGHTIVDSDLAKTVQNLRHRQASTDIQILLRHSLEEIRASWEGYKLLRSLGLPVTEALRAFSGVPTYMFPGLARLATRTAAGTGLVGGTGYGIYKGYQALTD